MSSPALEIDAVVKSFGGVRAVDGCSFAIPAGSITGLIGPNGAGKTTLFNIIAGALRPDSGHVRLDGHDVTGEPPHRLFARGLARTFQIPHELHEMSVLELTALSDELAGNLSGGQKKLLELGRTMISGAHVLLLDEPGAGVNPTLMGKLRDNIVRLNREAGCTFCIIEHDMDLVSRLCDPVVVMAEGKVLTKGTMDEIRRNEEVIDAYLGGGGGSEAHEPA